MIRIRETKRKDQSFPIFFWNKWNKESILDPTKILLSFSNYRYRLNFFVDCSIKRCCFYEKKDTFNGLTVFLWDCLWFCFSLKSVLKEISWSVTYNDWFKMSKRIFFLFGLRSRWFVSFFNSLVPHSAIYFYEIIHREPFKM